RSFNSERNGSSLN
ncbi:uridine phosphorylase, partial [Vibrio harveyi]